MSRCFPFPPPGYDRKHKHDDLDLLKEAKRKEKKHRKEKKDKERKKDKEKKEKDGSDEKRKDKKDRKEKKEKHKERKKHKEDHGKDKDKSSISEELTVACKPDDRSGTKPQAKVDSNNRSGFVNEGKNSIIFQSQNGRKPSQSCLPSQLDEESKFVHELHARIRDDQRGAGSQLSERDYVVGNEDQKMVSRAVNRDSSGLLVEEKLENKKRIDRKIDTRVKNDISASKMVQSLMPVTKAKVEGIAKPVDGQNGRRLDYREKYKDTGVTPKDRVKEFQTKEKEKKNENKNSIQNQLQDDVSKRSKDLANGTNDDSANGENIKKRKEHTNGFIHERETRPNKMQRCDPHQLAQNGRKLEPFHTPTKPSKDNRERLMNGIIDSHTPSPSPPKPKPSAEASKVPCPDSHSANKVPSIEELVAEASRRPPHPDSKYLDEVLTVPKMEWSELDDQEWLFRTKGPTRKRDMEPVGTMDDRHHVWSEAVHIESADVCALPYVIPY